MHEVRAEPLDHRTRSAGLEAGEACQGTSHSLRLPEGEGRGRGGNAAALRIVLGPGKYRGGGG